MMPALALLEAFDRHGAVVARASITQWPVTVGRSLECDLVLDDPFIAPAHLRIDRPDADGAVRAELLHTRNGARLQRRHYAQGERFDWPAGAPLELGRTRLSVRLADAVVAQEQALSQAPWRTLGTTVVLLALLLAVGVGSAWLEASEASKFLKSLPGAVMGLGVVLALWAGLWAVANKLFDGHLQFWRHVRIGSAILLGIEAMQAAAHLSAFAFSWETLSRFTYLLVVLVVAGGIYAHLSTVVPRRRTGLAWGLAMAVALGTPAWLGAQWMDSMRLSNKLYMSSLFPPRLRVAPAVPVAQFIQETETLRGRLDRRLRGDGHADDEE